MSTTVVIPGQEQAAKFDPKDYIRKANEKEHGKTDASGTPAAAAVAPPADETTKPADGDPDEKAEGGRVSRSQRRLLRQLGEAEGRAKTLEEIILRGGGTAKPAEPKPETAAAASNDPEPKVADFGDHNEYLRALSRWEARQETVKVVAKEKGQTEQETALRERVQAMTAKSLEESKEIPDWDAAIKEANDDGPEFKASEHPNLMAMIATSDVQAEVLYHLAKHPAALEKMLELTKSPEEQIRAFHRLEGRVEGTYRKKADAAGDNKEAKKPEAKPVTPPDRDAKKPRPSESIAPHGGSAPGGTISPTLADGKTLNPAWKEQMNLREGRHR